jgi:hypothetical protein
MPPPSSALLPTTEYAIRYPQPHRPLPPHTIPGVINSHSSTASYHAPFTPPNPLPPPDAAPLSPPLPLPSLTPRLQPGVCPSLHPPAEPLLTQLSRLSFTPRLQPGARLSLYPTTAPIPASTPTHRKSIVYACIPSGKRSAYSYSAAANRSLGNLRGMINTPACRLRAS